MSISQEAKKANQDALAIVQDLIQLVIDSEKGFREASDVVKDVALQAIFEQFADVRGRLANELQSEVQMIGERPRREGTWLAGMHRAWIEIRSAISGGDGGTILSEAKKGEDYIMHAYEEALQVTAGTELNAVVASQYPTIKQAHDEIRNMRDAYLASRD
jgi:uncharacterized protein (TIGR02284 family)